MSKSSKDPPPVLLLVTPLTELKERLQQLLDKLDGRYHLQQLSHLNQLSEQLQSAVPDFLFVDETTQPVASEKYAILQNLRREHPLLPVILLTHDDSIWSDETLAASGAHDYLPLTDLSPTLLARVLRYARRYQHKEAQRQHLAHTIPAPLMTTGGEAEIRSLNRDLERRVHERTFQLEAANKELEAFAYSISHDLRAPLRAMDGFSRLLIQDYNDNLDANGQHFLRRISENARQMGMLIDDLLKFSRLIREPLQRETVNATAVVRRVLATLDLDSVSPRLQIEVQELPPCQADARLLQQVFYNLIENALKYSHQREVIQIQVGAQMEADTAVYFVRDNGVGFDMTYADKIFGVFQRLHRSEEYEGTGVGLALVQRIIQRHGGRIWVEAALNEGATFYFTVS